MDSVLLAALTEEFLRSVLGLEEMDVTVIHAIIGWAYLNRACADCASHQAKLRELLLVALTGCDAEVTLQAMLGGLNLDASQN